ncbi:MULTISPECIES: carbon-nitrogen hydrolase family protein [Halomonas]|uniref:carbon-nitrogen hydrolase family protein n=1 Tax=Halomonas TaxID=2745 RepID=UPI001C95321A|nr:MULTISPECIES: carbon-nitrogen hydrolase family protein [Halomonas]MBY5968076.1 carbon-nitrogen hydrolase family protein [Halomonas denitrificans]MBY6031265.1 carbon-nitrogen hydrolase family protein [Halomonas sp. DP8Y7-1]MBY6206389.1 carbon-nitrogen hydrolase family protein [Halomonas sp. DP3Y7-2]MBY6227720.1 carbon-nitrogen hydrolase family protein [Halomonas sp. DP3Y7-1]MCA0915787.1 carbon-nitrogen hydrolase family protein [Halomonas denitrificans]
MQLALAQLPGIEGDIKANLEAALSTLMRHGDQVSLMIFPETHLSGFAEPGHVEDRALSLDGPEVARLVEASRQQDCALAIGLLERAVDGVYNTTILITPEEGIALTYRKTHLWPDERELVGLGDRIGVTRWRGLTVGLMICYDIEFPETARALGVLDADLMIVTNGNMDPYGPVHARAAQARAQDNQCFLAMANRCGEGAGLIFAGRSAVYSPFGETLFEAGREPGVHRVSLDLNQRAHARRDYDYLRDRRAELTLERDDDPQGPGFRLP